ncbi:hypothetical protein LPJ74_003741 [Coemansia sp. RSA 1843]|nr:hypothetical protein LPJ74_003741 [Coemansia sp. RSA 1843]
MIMKLFPSNAFANGLFAAFPDLELGRTFQLNTSQSQNTPERILANLIKGLTMSALFYQWCAKKPPDLMAAEFHMLPLHSLASEADLAKAIYAWFNLLCI